MWGTEGQAEWDGEPEQSQSTAERQSGRRGDRNHVIREQESKAMGRGAFPGSKEERAEQRRRRGEEVGGRGRPVNLRAVWLD